MSPFVLCALCFGTKRTCWAQARRSVIEGKADLIRAGDPLGVNLARIVGAAVAAARSAKANASVLAPTSVIS
jgi:hypothetical protein